MDIVYQLRGNAGRWSPTERRIADACLKDVAFAASATIDQLACRAGVSRSALSRFAKTVGCKDIRDLRMQLAQAEAVGSRFLRSTREGSSRHHDRFVAINTDADGPALESAADIARTASTARPSAFFRQIVGEIEATLQRHLQAFDEVQYAAAVAMLDEASMVYGFGMGGTSTIAAAELQHRLVRLGKPVAAYHDPVMMRIAAAAADGAHLIVAMSLTGVTPELLDAVRTARAYGAGVLALTAPDSPLAALADLTLPMIVAETDFIYKPTAARYGMLLGIDILVTELALLHADDSQERLRRVKLALDGYRRGNERLPLGD